MAEPLLLGQYHDAVTGALKKLRGCVTPMPTRKKRAPLYRTGHPGGLFLH